MMAALEIRGLSVSFPAEEGTFRAVDGIDLSIAPGEILALVGESGCGKSMTAFSIIRLVPPPGRTGGRVLFEGRDLLELPESAMRRVRGRAIALVFQEPASALDPVFTAGSQIVEAIRAHENVPRRAARARALELLRRVRMPAPDRVLRAYPHQLSGGMRQRVMLAMALACGPSLLIADEPTTALDVTTQREILGLILEARRELGMSILFVTHNLAIVPGVADRVAVMYAARIVETAPTRELFTRPRHPYTRALLSALPRLGKPRGTRLEAIGGQVPDPLALPRGCRFHPRCPRAIDRCREEEPELREVASGHRSACHLAEEL